MTAAPAAEQDPGGQKPAKIIAVSRGGWKSARSRRCPQRRHSSISLWIDSGSASARRCHWWS